MNRLVIILCLILLAVLPCGAGVGHTVPSVQRMITSDVFMGLRTRVDMRTQRLEVAGVAPGSPAARADIQPGDVLLTVNGHRVQSRESLFLHMRHYRAGESLQLKLLRNGEIYTVSVILESRTSPAVIGYVHPSPPHSVDIGNLVEQQRALAAALARPGTTLADVEEQLRRLCRDAGGRAARTGHIRLTYKDSSGLIRLRHRPGKLEIITSTGRDSYTASVLSQPWHTLTPACRRRFRNITQTPKMY